MSWVMKTGDMPHLFSSVDVLKYSSTIYAFKNVCAYSINNIIYHQKIYSLPPEREMIQILT